LLGETIPEKGNHLGYIGEKTKSALSWLDIFAGHFGDKMPAEERIHLPMCLTREEVYAQMLEETSKKNVLSQSHFYKVWSTERPNITIPKVR